MPSKSLSDERYKPYTKCTYGKGCLNRIHTSMAGVRCIPVTSLMKLTSLSLFKNFTYIRCFYSKTVMQDQRVIIDNLKFERTNSQDKMLVTWRVSNLLCFDVNQYNNTMTLGEDQPTEKLSNVPVSPCPLK
jgi:hypothetical protein